MYQILIGHIHHGLFHLRSNSIFKTELPSPLLLEPFKAMLLNRLSNVIEMLSGNAFDLTGLGNVLGIPK
jgi:hypothetical protein